MLRIFLLLFSRLFSYIKKIVIVGFVLSTIVFLFIYLIRGERLPLNNNVLKETNRSSIYKTIHEFEKDKSTLSKISLVFYRLTLCGMIGEACTQNPADGDKRAQNSLVGVISGVMAAPFYHPPASGIAWVHNSLENTGFIPNTYAAEGIGFSSIKGYLVIWKLFRDIAFMLLVLFMVILGFLIMFRVKLDGQAAVTVQSILPRIVITMILITFSFAIVGFLLDLMYAVILVGSSILFKMEPLRNALNPTGGYTSTQVDGLITQIQQNYLVANGNMLWPDAVSVSPLGTKSVFGVGTALFEILPGAFQFIIQLILSVTVGFGISQIATQWLHLAVVKPLTGFGLQGFTFGIDFGGLPNLIALPVQVAVFVIIAMFIPGIVFGIIILLTIMLFMFRLFFMLLSSYLKLLIYLIFSPIILMFNILPGNNAFSWWLKNVLGELAAFPTVILISITGQAIINLDVASGNGFRLPFLYGIDPKAFNVLVALGIILLTPDFMKMVKKFIGAEEAPFEFGIGTFLGGASIVTGAMGMGQNLMGLKHTLAGRKMMGTEKGLLDFIPGLGGIADAVRKASEAP